MIKIKFHEKKSKPWILIDDILNIEIDDFFIEEKAIECAKIYNESIYKLINMKFSEKQSTAVIESLRIAAYRGKCDACEYYGHYSEVLQDAIEEIEKYLKLAILHDAD